MYDRDRCEDDARGSFAERPGSRGASFAGSELRDHARSEDYEAQGPAESRRVSSRAASFAGRPSSSYQGSYVLKDELRPSRTSYADTVVYNGDHVDFTLPEGSSGSEYFETNVGARLSRTSQVERRSRQPSTLSLASRSRSRSCSRGPVPRRTEPAGRAKGLTFDLDEGEEFLKCLRWAFNEDGAWVRDLRCPCDCPQPRVLEDVEVGDRLVAIGGRSVFGLGRRDIEQIWCDAQMNRRYMHLDLISA